MPVYKEIESDIREQHTAERLQVDLRASGEDIEKMRLMVRFEVQIQKLREGLEPLNLGDPYADSKWLILDPSQDEDVRLACEIIQQKIGEKRYQQLHAPSPPLEPSIFELNNPPQSPPVQG